MTFSFDMHRIGQTIACLRRDHNMTQMALADAMGVSFQAVSNWERGESPKLKMPREKPTCALLPSYVRMVRA